MNGADWFGHGRGQTPAVAVPTGAQATPPGAHMNAARPVPGTGHVRGLTPDVAA
jgi:hypothetical protein